MKSINIFILSLIFANSFSQEIAEKEIKTDVNNVTVYIKGAQITRKKSIDLAEGKTILKFVSLSPFIDAKSIQVKAEGQLMVLSVNHQQNYLDKLEKPQKLIDLETRLQDIDDKIKLENTHLSILKEELAFLQENRDIGGKNQEISVSNLKDAAEFYSSRLTALKLKEIDRNKAIYELNKQRADIQNQINTLTSKKEYPTGEILVKVDTKKSSRVSFELSYLVSNAGWFPSYDIRAKNINEPVELIYKANVRQDTKVDWNNVKLGFSSSDPNVSGVAPELKTYYLNYNTLPPVYDKSTGTVSGKVIDGSSGEPLPGVNVMVQGTTIGTITDLDGNFSITVPNNATNLTFSYVGYVQQTQPISNSRITVYLNMDKMELDEVVVMGYGTVKKADHTGAYSGRTAGLDIEKSEEPRIRGNSSLAIPTMQVSKQTTVNFEIETPYTIKSDNKSYSVDMAVYNLPAFYQYYSVPKIDKDAFLIAKILDWEKYNLLEGEANIFFEDTYIGKTLLDIRYASDTLNISLGRDKNVSVSREKIKEYTSKQFIGTKKEDTRAWMITVKNSKNEKINMVLLDQVPVSTLEEIEVDVQKITGAKHNVQTGEIKWEFDLKPGEDKELELRYSVKYPKYRNLIIE
ncbi:MAG: mucoidy inhibitor MuiA family protein [Bacteroidales bacterium]|nr:mucoidy inhibitor MuiA family protein [Bacteroidales bacterium]